MKWLFMSFIIGSLLNATVNSFNAVPMLVEEELQYSKKEKISLHAFQYLFCDANHATRYRRELSIPSRDAR